MGRTSTVGSRAASATTRWRCSSGSVRWGPVGELALLRFTLIRLTLVGLFGLVSTPFVAAQTPTFEERYAEARAALVEGLLEYGDWCTENKLFAERASAYERVLELRPDDSAARRGLGYSKKKGEWIAPSRAKTYRNLELHAIGEAPARLGACLEGFTHALVAMLESGTLSSKEATCIEDEILAVDPSNALVHERRGEVPFDSSWVLPETITASDRRDDLERLVRATLVATPEAEPIEAKGIPASFGLTFNGKALDGVSVFTTDRASEAEDVARGLVASRDMFNALFGSEVELPSSCTIYLLDKPGEKEVFLQKHWAIGDDYREQLALLDGSGIIGTTDWAFWKGDRPKRLDGIVRMAIGYYLLAAFNVTLDHGALEEGLGLYLTKAVVGTRLTWFVNPDSGVNPDAAFAARKVLLDPSTNWIRRAHESLSDKEFVLEDLLIKRAAALNVDDLLVSYAIAAYLMEGRPDAVVPILTRVGEGEDAREVFEDVLEIGLGPFGPRVARWIEESYAAEFIAPFSSVALKRAWDALDAETKARTIEIFLGKVDALQTPQLALMRAVLASDPRPADAWPAATPLPFYDPKFHAPGLPIPRKRLDPKLSTVKKVRRTFFSDPIGRELVSAYRFDWGTSEISRTGDPNDLETVFANAIHGYAPGIDLAREIALRDIADDQLANERRAFAHAYTDRDGGVYPEITLFDAWASGTVIEMPDVDALGIIHDLTGDWDTWVSPVPGSEHSRLYAKIGKYFEPLRRYQNLREALADLLLLGEPASERYAPTRTNLHALWASVDQETDAMKARLPLHSAQDRWLDDWVETCRADSALFDKGAQRRSALRVDSDRIIGTITDALRSVGALDDTE